MTKVTEKIGSFIQEITKRFYFPYSFPSIPISGDLWGICALWYHNVTFVLFSMTFSCCPPSFPLETKFYLRTWTRRRRCVGETPPPHVFFFRSTSQFFFLAAMRFFGLREQLTKFSFHLENWGIPRETLDRKVDIGRQIRSKLKPTIMSSFPKLPYCIWRHEIFRRKRGVYIISQTGVKWWENDGMFTFEGIFLQKTHLHTV